MDSQQSYFRHYNEYIDLYDEDKSLSGLDWCDRRELLSNLDRLSLSQRHLLGLVETKRSDFFNGFKQGNYFYNAYPIIASEVPFATRLVCCGNKPTWGGTGSCQRWRFCSRCAFARQMAAIKTYLPAFYDGDFVFATISFSGTVQVNSVEEFSEILKYWNVIDASVKQAKEEGIILGAYYVEELSITDFLPLRILPHCHAIFHLNPFAGFDSRDIEFAMMAGLDINQTEKQKLKLPSSIRANAVETVEDFQRYLRYPTKAVELRDRYKATVQAAVRGDEAKQKQLNSELQMFLHGWASVTHGRYAIRRVGTMHHASKAYIGLKSSDLDYLKNALQDSPLV